MPDIESACRELFLRSQRVPLALIEDAATCCAQPVSQIRLQSYIRYVDWAAFKGEIFYILGGCFLVVLLELHVAVPRICFEVVVVAAPHSED